MSGLELLQSGARPRSVAVLLAVAGGLLLAFSLPPWPVSSGAWWLGVVGAAVLFVALDRRRWRGRLACGAAAGVGLYGPALWWMRDFSLPGYGLAVVVESAILAVAVVAVPRHGLRRAAAFPAALLLAEAFRGVWPFGGLPLAGIELGQVDGPLVHVARLGGRLLLVGAVGLFGAALGLLVPVAVSVACRRFRDGSAGTTLVPLAAAGAVVVVVALALAGAIAPDGADAGSLRVALVQGGGTRGLRAVDADPRRVFEAHVEATLEVRTPVDLVLWPEDVVDVNRLLEGSEEESVLSGIAASLGATLVVGVVEEVGDRFRNAAVAWGPDGRKLDRYDKVHLVPFGERIPWRGLVERLADVSAVPRDAIAGSGPGVLTTPAGRLGVMISYEVFFADRARAAARAGGRVLLVPTNASSFVDAQVPAQELAAARLRAIETGRWVLQAAPTGYSAVVDQRGRVGSQTPLGRRAVRHQAVVERRGQTLAVALGDRPFIAASLVIMVLTRQRLRR